MVINSENYLKLCHELMDEIYETQHENIDKAASILASSIANGGVMHIFGTGHSKEVGVEMTNRLGSLIPLHAIDMDDMMYLGGVTPEVYYDRTDIFERKAGVSDKFLNLYDIRKNDVFLLVSNSGINGIIIDIAKKVKEMGNPLIVMTSMKHTTVEPSRHPSGAKLYEFADVVLDNCCVHGDATLETEEGNKIVAMSSFADDLLADSLTIKTCDYLLSMGIEPPVISENEGLNNQLRDVYKGRI